MEKLILAVNVGNGHTRFGVFDGAELVGSWNGTTPASITRDEARATAAAVVSQVLGDEATLYGAILSCVVPSHVEAWSQALSDLAATRALVIGPGLKSGVRMRQDDPAGVGADRVANVAAAQERFGAPVIVVSLGTTTNVEVVDKNGSFAGGIISPGLELGVIGLSQAAARLPMVDLSAPAAAIGKNTRDAMRSGVVLGEAARIDGLLDMVFDELGYEAPVVITGSRADLVASLLVHEATVDETLVLRGLARIWHLNRG